MRALAALEATLTTVDRDKPLNGSFLDGHNSLMSGFDSNIGGGVTLCAAVWPRGFLLSLLMTVTFSMQIKLVFTDLPWV